MKLDLTGRVALVGGASKGIGAATAHALAESGARVVLMARSEKSLEEVKKSLPNSQMHHLFPMDLSLTSELPGRLERMLETVGPISVVICNTGGPSPGPIFQARPEEFMAAFEQHVVANQIMIQKLVPAMKAQQFGRIINIISTSVKIPIANLGVSNTIRAAVANWAKTLSVELAPFGITVNNVLPGYTATERLDELNKSVAARLKKTPEQVSEEWKKTIPAGRFADPVEIANVVAFLSSPLASYVNGINVPVDGGRTGCL